MNRRAVMTLLGRSRRARSRAGECGASACSGRATKTSLRLAFPRSRKPLRPWVGLTAATCGWTFAGGDDIKRIRALAQELVALQPDIILAGSTA
jgi:hypothetical protein